MCLSCPLKTESQIPACAACLYHSDDLFCCGHVDLLQAHYLNLLSYILQNTELGLLVQQVIHLNQTVYFYSNNLKELIFQSGVLSKCVHGHRRRNLSYFAIVNLKEADIGREIQVRILSIAETGENVVG